MTAKRTLANSGRRVVITGYGCVTPLGLDVESTWAAILGGKSGAGPITQFDASPLDTKFACEVRGYDPLQYIPKKDLRRMDRFIQLGFGASMQAIAQAKLDEAPNSKERIGVLLACGLGGLPMIEEQHKIALDRPTRVTPFFIPAVIANLLGGQVSIAKGYQGPNFCPVSACSSSAHAVGEAARIIERGDCDIMVCGGAEATVCMMAVAGFSSMKALSSRNEAPEKASRPFDVDRDGFVIGEGAATLILESYESAKARGAAILGEIAGYGTNADAYHMTSPSEGGEGGARCMTLALEDAGMKATDVDHVNMHGTSTPAGDVAESMAIEKVFGDYAQKLNCVSTKSMTGHLLGAAGALETLLSLLAVERGICPPTINLENQDPKCRLNYTPHEPVRRELRAAINNSFGFGGTNVSLVIKKFRG